MGIVRDSPYLPPIVSAPIHSASALFRATPLFASKETSELSPPKKEERLKTRRVKPSPKMERDIPFVEQSETHRERLRETRAAKAGSRFRSRESSKTTGGRQAQHVPAAFFFFSLFHQTEKRLTVNARIIRALPNKTLSFSRLSLPFSRGTLCGTCHKKKPPTSLKRTPRRVASERSGAENAERRTLRRSNFTFSLSSFRLPLSLDPRTTRFSPSLRFSRALLDRRCR